MFLTMDTKVSNFYDMGENIELTDVKKEILIVQKIGNKCPGAFKGIILRYDLCLPEVTLLNR